MFDSLEAQIKKDEESVSTSRERMVRYAVYALVAVVLFLALIVAIHLIG